MKVFRSTSLSSQTLTPEEALHVYNGFDCALLHDILPAMHDQLDAFSAPIYAFSRRLQAPVLEMCLRGIRISEPQRAHWIGLYTHQLGKIQQQLDVLAEVVWGKGLNPNSPKQLQAFFYGALNIPPIEVSKKGERKVSTARETLEKLKIYRQARPFVVRIMALRDVRKKLGVLRTGIESDGRMRSSFNIAGTETGRWSSSSGAFGSGTNLQNITPALRRIFVSDPGMKLGYIDLEQAESRMTAAYVLHYFGESLYLDACESGDLHTLVTKMIWPDELPWTGILREDKALAERPFYLQYSYRDMSKRGGHGTNYFGKPYMLARTLRVPQGVMDNFQTQYFRAFPGIPRWHRHVAQMLQTQGVVTTLFGRVRHFHGRLDDESTLREAIAFQPQSAVADLVNEGLFRVWQKFPQVHLLAQVHDAILFQYPETEEASLIPALCSVMEVPFAVAGREIVIPTEAAVGWNWGYGSPKNPDGMKKYAGPDSRTRTENPEARLLDQFLS